MKRLSFDTLIGYLNTLDHFVLLESNGPDRSARYSYLFTHPDRIITYRTDTGISFHEFCQIIEKYREKFYVAGYVPYETGYGIHDRLRGSTPPGVYESVLGVYGNPYIFDHQTGRFKNDVPELVIFSGEYSIHDVSVRTTREQYIRSVACIKNHIAEGNTYQVNYTTRLDFSFSGSPLALYRALRAAQPTAYSALMRYGDKWILSLSPELFFEISKDTITSRPMKGTMRRGRTNDEDNRLIELLHHDRKNRAENLMIVDLLRNDIGRIAKTGSVTVQDLFTVEKYKTVLQMTSTITGTLRKDISFYEILTSLFPCGSVTGAPKLSTMQIIRELEDSPRGVYTGAIGMIKPGGDMIFNVPIRTIEIEGSRGSMGIGSGIVWDSDPEQEYEECLLKAHFLTKPHKPVELIESLRYENGYHRLDLHLGRLLDSARYFDIPVERETIESILNKKKIDFKKESTYKIRLLINEDGTISIDHEEIPRMIDQPVRLKVSNIPTDSVDRYLYHKTTNRELYQTEYKRAQAEGYFDVIFRNEHGHITEGAISNVYIKENDILCTPPVTCGLLNGIYRRSLIDEGKAKEIIITIQDFLHANEIFVSNSVRGLLKGYVG